MSIPAIHEQLLRAIGVGIALVDEDSLEIRFQNEKLVEWFGEFAGVALADAFPDIDIAAMRGMIDDGGVYAVEISVKPKRRTLVIALAISRASVNDKALLVVECQNITRIHELESMIESYSAMVERNTREIEREKERVERLLLNIMPKTVYEEFKTFGVVSPQLFRNVSVVMLDFVGFTRMTEEEDPAVIVGELNDIFTSFDRISDQFGCERIKTMGDAYLAVSGMPDPNPDHARAVANCAIRYVRYLDRRNQTSARQWQCRVGIASGTVIGSVVGVQKYVYDIFGPAVNLASRLQVFARPMAIVAPAAMKPALNEEFNLEELGAHDIRGIGEMQLMTISSSIGSSRAARS